MVSSSSVTRANSYGAFRAAQSQEMGILAAKVDAVRRPPHVRDGSKAPLTASKPDFRFTPDSGHTSDLAGGPLCADFVAEVC